MPEAASRRLTAFIGWLALAAVVILLDQWSKYAVVGHFVYGEHLTLTSFFDLVRSHNQGAAFGMLNKAGGWQRWLFGALAVGVSGWIIWELYRHAERKLLSAALALVMGGALGNLIDRVSLGYVVDFLDFHWQAQHFPAFNLADSAITCGAALLLLEAYLDHRRAKVSPSAASGE